MFFITGADGLMYGPISVETMNQWALERRILPSTVVREVDTNAQMYAQEVPGFVLPPGADEHALPGQSSATGFRFGNGDFTAAPSYTQAPQTASHPLYDPNFRFFWRPLIGAGLALVFAFIRPSLGVAFGIIALIYALFGLRNPGSQRWIVLGATLFGCFVSVVMAFLYYSSFANGSHIVGGKPLIR